MREYYEILGLKDDASMEEVEKAYERLKRKYSEERFLEGEKGNEAAKNLTKIETAYREIKEGVAEKNEKGKTDYSKIEEHIRSGAYNDAQTELDNLFERDAEWHYLMGSVCWRRGWMDEARTYYQRAVNMAPGNMEYRNALAFMNRGGATEADFLAAVTEVFVKETALRLSGTVLKNLHIILRIYRL